MRKDKVNSNTEYYLIKPKEDSNSKVSTEIQQLVHCLGAKWEKKDNK